MTGGEALIVVGLLGYIAGTVTVIAHKVNEFVDNHHHH